MGRKRQDVTEAELALLRILWERGTTTIRQLADAAYPDGGLSEYATVKKLLARLEKKDCVRRDRANTAHCFEAAISQEELIRRRLQAVADNLCGGSRTPLLMHLLQSEPLTGQERQELREHLLTLSNPQTTRSTAEKEANASSTRNRRK